MTPSTSIKAIEKSNNPFAAFVTENEEDEDAHELDDVSKQLSQQFGKGEPSPSPSDERKEIELNPSPTISSLKEPTELTLERYDEIMEIIKDGRHDEVSIVEFELYILMSINKATEQFNCDVEDQNSETTKSISHHKNQIKKDLEKKTAKFEATAKEVQHKADELRQDMTQERN